MVGLVNPNARVTWQSWCNSWSDRVHTSFLQVHAWSYQPYHLHYDCHMTPCALVGCVWAHAHGTWYAVSSTLPALGPIRVPDPNVEQRYYSLDVYCRSTLLWPDAAHDAMWNQRTVICAVVTKTTGDSIFLLLRYTYCISYTADLWQVSLLCPYDY